MLANNCESKSPTETGKLPLRRSTHNCFTGLGNQNRFQLKLHVDETVPPVAHATRRIPFSKRQKLVEKLMGPKVLT